jgi:hypothetical protein
MKYIINMPPLEKDFFVKNFGETTLFTDYPVFIETGTYMGETTYNMSKLFNEVHTIEINKKLYERTKGNMQNKVNNVKFHLGDSSILMSLLCDKIKQPALFFLDGHWSGGITGKGNKDCPLMEELDSIMHKFTNNAVLIIDDCRLFGQGPTTTGELCNWEDIHMDKILEITKLRTEKHYLVPSEMNSKDRLIIFLNKK